MSRPLLRQLSFLSDAAPLAAPLTAPSAAASRVTVAPPLAHLAIEPPSVAAAEPAVAPPAAPATAHRLAALQDVLGRGVVSLARAAPQTVPEADALSLDELAGRLVEVAPPPRSAAAGLCAAPSSWAVARLAEAHARGELAAWIVWQPRGMPYAPDLAAAGVDVAALPIIQASQPSQILQAADLLLRSGAFGLVLADWPQDASPPAEGPQGRLLALCQKHDAALLILHGQPLGQTAHAQGQSTAPAGRIPTAASWGALVSLRIATGRQIEHGSAHPSPRSTGRLSYALHTSVHKDKRRGPGRVLHELRQAPEGMAQRASGEDALPPSSLPDPTPRLRALP